MRRWEKFGIYSSKRRQRSSKRSEDEREMYMIPDTCPPQIKKKEKGQVYSTQNRDGYHR
jgi:hypothetical protein